MRLVPGPGLQREVLASADFGYIIKYLLLFIYLLTYLGKKQCWIFILRCQQQIIA